MTHRSHGRGTLMLDREFEVGRLHRASGTNDPRVKREIEAMLTTFATQGRFDIITALIQKQFSPMYAFAQFKAYGVHKIPTADVLAPLKETWERWAKNLTCSDTHRESIRKTGKHLGDGLLNDVPDRLQAFQRLTTAKRGNQARAHVMGFLRDTVGRSHPLWIQVRDSAPKRVVKSKPRAILTVDEVRRLAVQLGPKAGEVAWSLAAMGMLPKEYWTDGWEVQVDRIHAWGQKRKGRDRDIPRWTVVYTPRMARDTFRRTLRETTGGKVRPTDFRRCFARWMDEAGVAVVNQRFYMGHGTRTMTDLYKTGEVSGQIETDAAKLRAYAGEPDTPTQLRRLA